MTDTAQAQQAIPTFKLVLGMPTLSCLDSPLVQQLTILPIAHLTLIDVPLTLNNTFPSCRIYRIRLSAHVLA